MKLTAEKVAYSSVVGGSVAVHDAAGAVVAIVMVSVPDPGRDYKATAMPILDHIVKAFPCEADIPPRVATKR